MCCIRRYLLKRLMQAALPRFGALSSAEQLLRFSYQSVEVELLLPGQAGRPATACRLGYLRLAPSFCLVEPFPGFFGLLQMMLNECQQQPLAPAATVRLHSKGFIEPLLSGF